MRRLLLILALLLGTPAAAREAPLRILAASSLTEAMTDLAAAWARAGHPRPVLVFAASSALARQLEAGAPADVFVSADEEWMTYAQDRKLIDPRTRATLATNHLVLVVPIASPARVAIRPGFDLAALVGTGRWVTGDPDAVPVGRYARQALTKLGAWAAAAPRLARTENVRAALAFVERGDAAAGIVYATDARASAKVRIAGVFPAASHAPIRYPVAATRGAQAPQTTRFLAFLRSPAARRLLGARGFGAP